MLKPGILLLGIGLVVAGPAAASDENVAIPTARPVQQAMAAAATEPIVGLWRRPDGMVIRSELTDEGYCGTVISGKYTGRSIGCVKGTGGSYTGQVRRLNDGQTYQGHATVRGNVLAVSGCILLVLCQTEKLVRHGD